MRRGAPRSPLWRAVQHPGPGTTVPKGYVRCYYCHKDVQDAAEYDWDFMQTDVDEVDIERIVIEWRNAAEAPALGGSHSH